jgi:hypothetical protein
VGGVSRETVAAAITSMKVLITGICGLTGLSDKLLALEPAVLPCAADNPVHLRLFRRSQRSNCVGMSNGSIHLGSLDRRYFVIWI